MYIDIVCIPTTYRIHHTRISIYICTYINIELSRGSIESSFGFVVTTLFQHIIREIEPIDYLYISSD